MKNENMTHRRTRRKIKRYKPNHRPGLCARKGEKALIEKDAFTQFASEDEIERLFEENKHAAVAFAASAGVPDPEFEGTGILLNALRIYGRTGHPFNAVLWARLKWDCLSKYRAWRKRPNLVELNPENCGVTEESPDSILEDAERKPIVDRLLSLLPPKDSELIRLHFLRNVPFTEIAVLWRVKSGTLRCRVSRAFEQIRKYLDASDQIEMDNQRN
jgi:RNA polymerase sigma factor (sigma-70 family)